MIKKIGVIGAGQMGNGITHVLASSGYDVILKDVNEDQLKKAIKTIQRNMDRQVSKGKLSEADRDAAINRISCTMDYADFKACDLVIEAATENPAVKIAILKELFPNLKPDAIIATNTSSISVTKLASSTDRPEKFMGMHFMNPVPVMVLADQLSNIPIKTKENIEIHWLQDDSAKLVKIKINTLLEIFPESINFSEISIQPLGNDRLNKSVEIPLEFSLNTKLDELSNTKITLNGSIDGGLKIKDSNGLIKLGAARFNIASTLELDNSVKQLGFTNSRIDLSGVDFMFDYQQSNMKIAEYRLEAVAQNIQLNLDDLVNTRWQLKGVFTSPEVVGTLIKQDFNKSDSLVSAVSNQSDNAKTLRLDSQIEVNFEVVKTDNIVSNGALLLSRLQVIDPNYQLKGPLEFSWQSVQSDLTQGSASLVYHSRQNQVVGLDFDSMKVEANLSLDGHQIEGAGKLSINQQDLAPFSFKFDKTASRLIAELKENQLANQISNHFLAAIGKQNKMALEILAGEVVHSAGVGIDKILLLDSEFAIRDMLFQFDNNQLQGLNVAQKLTSIEPLVLQTQINIDKIAFASGLSIDNLSASLSSRSIEDIRLHSVKADLLEGHLIADKLQIGANNLTALPFQLKQISLTELIFLIDISGLYGEGKLDFYLPVSFESDGVTVDEGHFKATEKGIIKYTSGQEDSGVEENIALQALKNFRYDELDGWLSYNKAGEYHIKLHLLGANPDLYNGYPIDFVLNLRGELSGIFRSLFLTGNFEEAVMQQVKADQLEQKSKTH
ncbi:MAG: hypothetical protein COA65_08805 [Rhodospirillaceae bacterium]|nr:MAG: hypothetical protein COA65_08805 [Rhodospirillaceae bacterium]